ncbi:uncharacterized protein LOC129922702 [Biomphalaria glabrata]|uniref:Uncharacterized protein LOC129922702 n=1 Tax=Biomphalaria glabrata TaxID=6526 RepID=A0A9W2YSH5_BIOGL|nr:uncharacterized protein LOC129922702 [Biomphalaria glabrata]
MDSTLDVMLPLGYVGQEYFILPAHIPGDVTLKSIIKIQSFYDWTQITLNTNISFLLKFSGDTYETPIDSHSFHYICGNTSFYVYQIISGLHGDVCVTSLLPSSLWRYSYDLARSSDAYNVYVYIVVKATVTSGRVTNDTIQWTCQSIAGTAFSGCYTVFPTDTNYLHLQLLSKTDPFGAYLVGYDNTSLFCHPLGIADIMEPINTKPFQHALYLQRLKEKHKSTCESMTSEKPTLTTILSIANDSSISSFSTTDSNRVLETTEGFTHAQSDTSASVAITTPQSVTWPKTSPGSTGLREAIISFLKVDHSELSSHKRNLISAPDPRTSAQICGFSGILLVLSVVLLIIFPDLVSIVRFCIIFIKSKICFKN